MNAPVLLCALLLPSAGPAVSASEDAGRERVVELLLASVDAPALEDARLVEELRTIRPTPTASLFQVLGGGGIPADWAPAGRGFVHLDRERVGSVRSVLLEATPAELRALLDDVAEGEPRMRFREAGVDVLGEIATAADLPLLWRLAGPLREGADVLPRSLLRHFEKALFRTLERDPGALGLLASAFEDVHAGLQSSVVDAVERLRSQEALETLAGYLNAFPRMDPIVLTAIARVAQSVPHPVGDGVPHRVRAFLSLSDPRLVVMAARAAGKLEDFDALPVLLELLERGDPDLRGGVLRALRDLTRLRFREDPRLWRDWYREESRWWAEESLGFLADLESPDPIVASRAIGEVSQRRLHRHQLAAALGECLVRPEPELVRVACEGLGQLGSRAAVPALTDCLEHSDEAVREAAWASLQRITGLELPPDPRLWRSGI